MCDIDLFFLTKWFSEQLGQAARERPEFAALFLKGYCQNTAKSSQELCYRLFYGCSRRFYEIRQKEQKIQRNLENNVVAIIFTGKVCSRFTV